MKNPINRAWVALGLSTLCTGALLFDDEDLETCIEALYGSDQSDAIVQKSYPDFSYDVPTWLVPWL